MTLTTNERYDAARRLISAALGTPRDDALDYERVTDIGVGYASRSYGSPETVWVLGNWNDKHRYLDEGETHPEADQFGRVLVDGTMSRLAEALQRIDVECEWLDEWTECRHCNRLIRTSADSYSFTLDAMWTMDGYVCGDCAMADVENSLIDGDFVWRVGPLDEYEPEVSHVVSFCSTSDLEAIGFKLWTGNPEGSTDGRHENGWHPGQDSTPTAIAEEIAEALDCNAEIVFYLDENSQFYVGFSAWVRRFDWNHDMTCGVCGRTWNDENEPTPSARCPYEYDHDENEENN